MSSAWTGKPNRAARRHHSVSTPVDRFIIVVAQRIGGERAKEYERLIKFAFVGLLGFAIDSGTVLVLQNTLLPPVSAANETLDVNVALATTVAFVLAVCSNFVWNRLWTYPEFSLAVSAPPTDAIRYRQRHRLGNPHALD